MSKAQNKNKALEALIDSNSLTEAAEKAGISRKTLYNYLHTEKDFARAYEELMQRQAIEYLDTINSDRDKARSVLREILEDKEQPAAIRLKAAQTILTTAESQEKIGTVIIQNNLNRTSDTFASFFE